MVGLADTARSSFVLPRATAGYRRAGFSTQSRRRDLPKLAASWPTPRLSAAFRQQCHAFQCGRHRCHRAAGGTLVILISLLLSSVTPRNLLILGQDRQWLRDSPRPKGRPESHPVQSGTVGGPARLCLAASLRDQLQPEGIVPLQIDGGNKPPTPFKRGTTQDTSSERRLDANGNRSGTAALAADPDTRNEYLRLLECCP